MRLFHKAGDYEVFERVLAEGLEALPDRRHRSDEVLRQLERDRTLKTWATVLWIGIRSSKGRQRNTSSVRMGSHRSR